MKCMIAIILISLHVVASAQTPTYNGISIKKGLDAYDRMYVTRNATDEDFQDASMLIAYTSGMLAVHRQNNLSALILFAASSTSTDGSTKKKLSEVDEARRRALLALTPLLTIPDNVPPEQLVAILRKYLEAHPEKWNKQAATLITEALVEAFPRK